MIDKDYYTILECVDILGVTRNTIYLWLRDGNLRGVKFGRQWRIPKAEIKRIQSGEFHL